MSFNYFPAVVLFTGFIPNRIKHQNSCRLKLMWLVKIHVNTFPLSQTPMLFCSQYFNEIMTSIIILLRKVEVGVVSICIVDGRLSRAFDQRRNSLHSKQGRQPAKQLTKSKSFSYRCSLENGCNNCSENPYIQHL